MGKSSREDAQKWVSSFLMAHQHILGYLVPYHSIVDLHKKEDIIKAI